MTREDALTMIIASIAMEELALSHILNAEGEKLQYILGLLPGKCPCACPQDVLAVNKSVTALVEAVTQNQMLLKNKLAQVLEFCPLPPPPPPVCKPSPCPCGVSPCCPPCRPAPDPVQPCKKSALQLIGQREKFLWKPDCRLAWNQGVLSGNAICWDKCAPAQIRLDPEKSYTVQYTLNVCAASPAEGKIFLKQSLCGVFTDTPPLHFSIGRPARGQETLHCACVLRPCRNSSWNGGCCASVSLLLDAKAPLCVEQAVMDVIEI